MRRSAHAPSRARADGRTPVSGKARPRRSLAGALLLALMTFAAYVPAMRGGFVWDDDKYVADNPHLREEGGLRRIWLTTESEQYYPLVFTSFWLEYRLYGLNPAGYHIVNVALHAANAVLVWLLLRRLGVPGAWLAGAVFALHPVHAESVAWVTERKNVLSGLFYLLSLGCWLRFDASGGRRCYAAALVLFVAALLSKTVTCSLPVVLLLLRWYRGGRLRWRDSPPVVPFLLLGAAGGLLTSWYEHVRMAASDAVVIESFAGRLIVAARALLFYAGKLVLPHPLVFVYPRWAIDPSAISSYWPVLAVALLAAAVVWLTRRVHRAIGLAAAFFAVTLFPALGFFNVVFMRFSYVADHFAYLASIGPVALCVGGLSRRLRGPRRAVVLRGAQAAGAAVLAAYGALTMQHARVFGDLDALWRDTLAKNPDAWLASNNLGVRLMRAGRLREAEDHFRRMLSATPVQHEAATRAHSNLASLRLRQERYEEAIAHCRQSLQYDSTNADAHSNWGAALAGLARYQEAVAHYETALAEDPSATTHNNLANALCELGRYPEAIAQFRAALVLDPSLADVRRNLALALSELGRFEEAISEYRAALALRPDDAAAHAALGRAYEATGRAQEAMEAYRSALRVDSGLVSARVGLSGLLVREGRFAEAIDVLRAGLKASPSSVVLANELAWLLATCPQAGLRDGAAAVALAESACAATRWDDPRALMTLSAGLAETGRLADAVRVAERALQLAQAQKQDDLAVRLREMLRVLQTREPRAPP